MIQPVINEALQGTIFIITAEAEIDRAFQSEVVFILGNRKRLPGATEEKHVKGYFFGKCVG